MMMMMMMMMMMNTRQTPLLIGSSAADVQLLPKHRKGSTIQILLYDLSIDGGGIQVCFDDGWMSNA